MYPDTERSRALKPKGMCPGSSRSFGSEVRQKPSDAFVAVQYRNSWFRIDDDDLASKMVFVQLMELFTMIDTGSRPNLPVVTIPAH